VSWQPRGPGVGSTLLVRLAVLAIVPALFASMLAASCVGGRLNDALDDGPTTVTAPRSPAETVTVRRVVDGDTIVTAEAGTVRLIGVDTPETRKPRTPVQCYGPEASAATHQAMPPGITVGLVYEASADGGLDRRPRARLDRYGRTLAYVYLTDGTFWNLALVARGLARARYYHPNDDHRADFAAAQAKAEAADVGGWGACDWRTTP
jgi:micrococcal nuclease